MRASYVDTTYPALPVASKFHAPQEESECFDYRHSLRVFLVRS